MSLKQVTKDNRSRLLQLPLVPLLPVPQPTTGMAQGVHMAQVSPLRLAEVFCGFIFVLLWLLELGLCQSLTPLTAFWEASPQENQKGEWSRQDTPFPRFETTEVKLEERRFKPQVDLELEGQLLFHVPINPQNGSQRYHILNSEQWRRHCRLRHLWRTGVC